MPEKVHDKGYKRILSKKKNFLDLLKCHVQGAWVNELREENLELIDKQFILKDFRDKEADIVYKATLDGHQAIFYVLLELQSSVDYTMPFRLLLYMVEVMRRAFLDTDQKIREAKTFRLPAVVPIVLYNGGEPWSAVPSFREYLEGHQWFGANVLDFQYVLLNINKIDESALLDIANLVNAVFFLDQKNAKENLPGKLRAAAKIVGRLSEDQRVDFIAWLRDVLYKKLKKLPRVRDDVEGFIQGMKEGDGGDMTYAIERMLDELEERGIEKGVDRGMLLRLIKLIDVKIQKNKSREQIIDELEMDEESVKVLDHLEEYRALAESAIHNP
ncbi:MAG: Rpn family recombination-promoting nuclease/putative transposase [Clostridiales bacterium]|jgi:predicted transposase/invertase (TIGR01784 family)|nr:Rpn family recombination-promoting nuclease/putative transposase [Clostridiales bacterium]